MEKRGDDCNPGMGEDYPYRVDSKRDKLFPLGSTPGKVRHRRKCISMPKMTEVLSPVEVYALQRLKESPLQCSHYSKVNHHANYKPSDSIRIQTSIEGSKMEGRSVEPTGSIK